MGQRLTVNSFTDNDNARFEQTCVVVKRAVLLAMQNDTNSVRITPTEGRASICVCAVR